MQAIELATTISMQGGIALPANCKALYGRAARLILLVDDDVALAPQHPSRLARQTNLRQALGAVAQAGTFAHIDNATAWQREVRADRRHLLGARLEAGNPSYQRLRLDCRAERGCLAQESEALK